MHPPHDASDLDGMTRFAPDMAQRLRVELQDVADPRLEEADAALNGIVPFAGRLGRLKFAAMAAMHNWRDVLVILRRAKPWQLPLRLGRLVTAAVSSLVVLLMTAEAWEAGMSQPAWRLTVLSLVALGVATFYLIRKQRLLVARPRRGRPARHSERRSVGNVAVTLAVLIGMSVTYGLLFTASLAAAWLFYPDALVRNWAASVELPIAFHHYVRLAAGVAALGLSIGGFAQLRTPRLRPARRLRGRRSLRTSMPATVTPCLASASTSTRSRSFATHAKARALTSSAWRSLPSTQADTASPSTRGPTVATCGRTT